MNPLLARVAHELTETAPAAARLALAAGAGRAIDPDAVAGVPLPERERLVGLLRWAQARLGEVPAGAMDERELAASRRLVFLLLAALSAVRLAEVMPLLLAPAGGRA